MMSRIRSKSTLSAEATRSCWRVLGVNAEATRSCCLTLNYRQAFNVSIILLFSNKV
jgi:hypothetical protein